MSTHPIDAMVDAIDEIERRAVRHHDGHLTIMRFTCGWKAVLGAQPLAPYPIEYKWLFDQPTFRTADAAIRHALEHNVRWP